MCPVSVARFYGVDGKLIGVPGYKEFYHEQLDRSQWGLVRAAKVASYRGFVFATMDPEAPELNEFLGPILRLMPSASGYAAQSSTASPGSMATRPTNSIKSVAHFPRRPSRCLYTLSTGRVLEIVSVDAQSHS
jgi:phenylpropionate dioxygenase-like ring-hydroxylating dioxygenase large terminal subunit